MAHYLPIETIIERGYITDVDICSKLLTNEIELEIEKEGSNPVEMIPNPIVVAHIHQPMAYLAIYGVPMVGSVDNPHTPDIDESKTVEQIVDAVNAADVAAQEAILDDNDASNNVEFTIITNTLGQTAGTSKTYRWTRAIDGVKVGDVFNKLKVKLPAGVSIDKLYEGTTVGDTTTYAVLGGGVVQLAGTDMRNTLNGKTFYTAHPNPVMCTLTLTNPDSSKGTVTGGGSYAQGTSVTISATPNDGYQFSAWTDGTMATISNENPYTFTINNNVEYIANWVEA